MQFNNPFLAKKAERFIERMKPDELAQSAIQYLADEECRFAKKEELHDGEIAYKVYAFPNGAGRLLIDDNKDNLPWARKQYELTTTTTVSGKGREVCQLIQAGLLEGAATMELRSFSAIHNGKLYIPTVENKLLEIDAEGARVIPNLETGICVEHPTGSPFRYAPNTNSLTAFHWFEKLLVHTQATTDPNQQWLVAMRLGLFPYLRDLIPRRMIQEHTGPSQKAGKTTGVERFTQLHGLGELLGNVSPAAIQRLGDYGLLALDNREQVNMSQELGDYFLFASTGAQAGRATADGSLVWWHHRPIVVVTSVEGISVKTELKNRVLPIEYRIPDDAKRLRQSEIIAQVQQNRDSILSALVDVFVEFFREDGNDWVQQFTPISEEFREDFEINARLLRAYARVTGRGAVDDEWAESIIRGWHSETGEEEETGSTIAPLLHHLIQFPGQYHSLFNSKSYTHQGQLGQLHIVSPGEIVTPLRLTASRANQDSLPLTATSLVRRLQELNLEADGMALVQEKDEPELLRRKTRKRYIGLFVPSEGPSEVAKCYQDVKV